MAILPGRRRFLRLALLTAIFVTAYLWLGGTDYTPQNAARHTWRYIPSSFDWGNRRQAHPVDESTMSRPPQGAPLELPRIQHKFSQGELSESHNKTQRARRDAVRAAAQRSWRTYRKYAWGRDEVIPQKRVGKDSFAGWGATLVDSLDTLWIMGMKEDFRDAVLHVGTIDWDKTTSRYCSLFETTIRYLGGLLSAYDLSQERILLDKALELGEMLYAGFDTPNHMPANNFDFQQARKGKLVASTNEATAAAGSLSLEFTRLSQLTGNPKFYNAIDNVKKALATTQDATHLPGMWPVFVNLQKNDLTSGTSFTLGASADSAYEYLSKMHLLLGGLDPAYETLHTKAMATAKKHLVFRPMLPDDNLSPPPDILFSGTVFASANGQTIDLRPEVQHLGCFAGGMFALGGKLFNDDEHVKIGEQLARGCAWAYSAFPTGIMPEVSDVIPCKKKKEDGDKTAGEGNDLSPCAWDKAQWKQHSTLPKPFTGIRDPQYLLRPEAIESVFVLYRITGKADLLDVAWEMFESVRKATETEYAYSAIQDVRATGGTVKTDAMESFWIAETLKYFYLIFSEPELISLDDYVLNTEAHPLKLPRRGPNLSGWMRRIRNE